MYLHCSIYSTHKMQNVISFLLIQGIFLFMWSSFRVTELVAPTNSYCALQVTDITGWMEKNNKIWEISICMLREEFSYRIILNMFSVFETSNFGLFLRPNVQIDNGQTVHENRTLTHNLCSNQFKKPDRNLWSHQLWDWAWSVIPSSPHFCPCFQFRTSQRKPNNTFPTTYLDIQLLVSLPPISPGLPHHSEHTWAHPSFSPESFPMPAFEFLPNLSWRRWLTPLLQQALHK